MSNAPLRASAVPVPASTSAAAAIEATIAKIGLRLAPSLIAPGSVAVALDGLAAAIPAAVCCCA